MSRFGLPRKLGTVAAIEIGVFSVIETMPECSSAGAPSRVIPRWSIISSAARRITGATNKTRRASRKNQTAEAPAEDTDKD